MKSRLFITLSLLAILSMLLSGAAFYKQVPENPERTPRTERTLPDRRGLAGEDSELLQKMLPKAADASRFGILRTHSPVAVTPGTPGLSFRFDSTIGITQHGYESDTTHLNSPDGLFMDSSGNLYVAENRGARVLRYDSSGTNTLEIGQASYQDPTEDTFSWPNDVAVDGSGNIWVVDQNRVTRHAGSDGSFEMSFPTMDNHPWWCRDDNEGFCNPLGIAIDSGGFLYISDSENYRVQVFTISGGTPVYSTTIGVTGVQGNDNDHFAYPAHIATHGTGTVFVADGDNARVQKCTYGPPWSCTTFYDTLSYPWGITVDSSGNVYIVDNGDGSVIQCDPTGTVCSTVVDEYDGLNDPNDVVVDASGNLYISEWYNTFRVAKYSSGVLSTFVGTTGVPFVPDTDHIYSPFGIAVDSSGNLYVSERYGFRWLKYDSSGNQVLAKGEAGIAGNDPNHFGDNLMGSPAFNASNLLYVPAGNRHCVRVYDQNYVYQGITLGICGVRGDDGTHFWGVAGVAISPLDGKIYVVDRTNNKVKIFSSTNSYIKNLGDGTGNPTGYGTGDYQFDNPSDVAIDTNGTIYVADRNNERVQVYDSSGVYQRSFGQTDDCDWDFDHLCGPHGVGVDAQNRVYIADTWNNRVQVFDSTGAYLTTLSGQWGPAPGDMESPADVAIDKDYNVFVTDMDNHRISKYAMGVKGWQQSNLNGFVHPGRQWIWSLESFGDYLYASPDGIGNSAELWRMSDATGWNQVSGFSVPDTWIIADMTQFNSKLYASTYGDEGAGIFQSDDGLTWTRVYTGDVGTDYNMGIWSMAVFSNTIYAGTDVVSSSPHGTQVLKSSTGTAGSWTVAEPDGFGDPQNVFFNSFQVYGSCLYVGVENYDFDTETDYGAQMWRTCNGSTWNRVDNSSFGDTNNLFVSAMEVFNNKLYISTGYAGDSVGAQLYRCTLCNGSDWEHIVDDGLGNPHNNFRATLISFDGWLFWSIYNGYGEGMTVWLTKDGDSWQQVGFAGFGDANNRGPAGDQTASIYKNRLFFGSRNWANGGEIWEFLVNRVYLPLVLH